jgi:Na+/H+ antiporter NhaD/arsenite permease-like protein
MSVLRLVFARLAADWLLLGLIVLFPIVFWWAPSPAANLPGLVDWKTVAALAGLMVLSRGLELSGALDRIGRMVLMRLFSLRRLALVLVVFAAILSAVLTNDVALFVTVPLTVGLSRMVALPVGRLVIFQALAVNAGSALSPVGNPQNLYLWQLSGTGFVEFAFTMLPIAGVMMGLVLALLPLGFEKASLTLPEKASPLPLKRGLMVLSLAAYPLFLWAVNAGFALQGAAMIIVLFGLAFGHVLRGVDWALLLVFVLMFVNLGLLGQISAVSALVENRLQAQGAVFAWGAGLSQLMSNVPAAIFLAPFTDDWRALAWGVNVGGFGLAIGSLANLIALRLARMPGLWREFHLWSLPMLGLSAALGSFLLRF